MSTIQDIITYCGPIKFRDIFPGDVFLFYNMYAIKLFSHPIQSDRIDAITIPFNNQAIGGKQLNILDTDVVMKVILNDGVDLLDENLYIAGEECSFNGIEDGELFLTDVFPMISVKMIDKIVLNGKHQQALSLEGKLICFDNIDYLKCHPIKEVNSKETN